MFYFSKYLESTGYESLDETTGVVRAWIGLETYFLLFKLYGLEHNYYANYFQILSDLDGVGYGEFEGSRVLTGNDREQNEQGRVVTV